MPSAKSGATLKVDGTGPAVKVNGATVTKADLTASNGTIHVIDTVLIPSTGGVALFGLQIAKAHGAEVDFRQSNHEGELIDWLHEAGRTAGETLGVVLNAGAYTHTSVALGDAIKAIAVPVIEVHLSNVHAREPFRHHSYLSPACAGIVVGFGVAGYALAIDGLARTVKAKAATR